MQGSLHLPPRSCPSSSWHSFWLGSAWAPTRSSLGCPLPPILPFQTEGLLSGGWMENKAPLSGWRRIGVMGRGRARKGVAVPWPPAGLQATPNTISGVGQRAAGARPGRGWRAGWGKGVSEVKTLLGVVCWGQRERTPHFLAERDGEARKARPITCFLYVTPSGNFSIPGPRLGQGLSTPQPPPPSSH